MGLPRLNLEDLDAERERCETTMSGAQIRREVYPESAAAPTIGHSPPPTLESEVLRYRPSVDDAVPLATQLIEAWRVTGAWRDMLQGPLRPQTPHRSLHASL